ncbi:MAG: aminotransferase class I/II-fold pyridoxal phosphate-dependent enzyme [Clostridiales Family XIII bacterium]|jgi:histidinol-phosphate aminotransferase|nr:aminotransferase class I/II-fold pyridoxal phosphate-dependent enzyme [Clostridiales Family XIII bacterium]
MTQKHWEENLYRGKPYVSGEQPKTAGLIKLNTNENPYPPAPGVARALAAFAEGGANAARLRLYPPADGGALREALAAYHGVGSENVFVGNGSDEALALAFRACFDPSRIQGPVRFADVTYSFYPVWCAFFGIPYETVALDAGFRADAAFGGRQDAAPTSVCDANAADGDGRGGILPPDAVPAGGVVVCNPNAPTGIGEDEGFVREILNNHSSCVVVVDEAYADFAAFSAIPLTREYPNLLVTRSFSKGRSLAGLRVGYAVGSAAVIRALLAAKDSYNSYPVGHLEIACGVAALEDEAYYRETAGRVAKTRDETAAALRGLGYDVPDSQANFLFVGCGSRERAQRLFAFLREGAILVRYFDKPRIDDRLRISVGTDEDMAALLARMAAFGAEER